MWCSFYIVSVFVFFFVLKVFFGVCLNCEDGSLAV